jgi:quercetin dioxygenase-like cupin family protein
MGLGVGVATIWALRAPIIDAGLGLVRGTLERLFARDAFRATSAYEMDWVRNACHQDCVKYFMKPLHHNLRTGNTVMLVRYPAGEMNPPHRHPVGHGIYVLQGTLVTHRGNHPRDTFVWFPPNETMTHGAGPDEDLLALFMTGEKFRTDYVKQ